MVIAVRWALVALLAGCVHDSYECQTNADCNTGTDGRCEIDHHCTTIDDVCFTNRRYTQHSGDLSSQCYTGTVPLANACMGGQPPAVADGCAATVCTLMPSCCATGWSDACAGQAQVSCPEQACTTRIAITATVDVTDPSSPVELWELAWNGQKWLANKHDNGKWIGYAAPAPGTTDPRLMGISVTNTLVVGDTTIPLAGRVYHEATSVDFDRDRRDVIAVTWDDGGMPPKDVAIELIHLDDGTTTDVQTNDQAIIGLVWGAYDDDAYPDAAAGKISAKLNSQVYYFLDNMYDSDTESRFINTSANSSFTNSTTTAPSLRSLEWADFDGDGKMDFVAFGNDARVHTAEGNVHVTAQPKLVFDCSPIEVFKGGKCSGMPTDDLVSVIGAVVPTSTHPDLVLSTDVTRELYRVTDLAAMTQPKITKLGLSICAVPGPTCQPILAVVARDLDHDGVVDIIAIDAQLHVFTALGGGPFVLSTPAVTANTFTRIRTRVAGSPATP
jgi:hypothetical protein